MPRLCFSCHRLKHALNCPRRRANRRVLERKALRQQQDQPPLPPVCTPEDKRRILEGHVYRIDGDAAVFMEDAIMESHLGRKLGANERVRHKNGDFLDNRGINLELITV
jgi:hypothetical protein